MLAHHHDHDNHNDHDHRHGPESHRIPYGREATRTFWNDFFEAVPDAEIHLEGLAVAGDEVLGRMVLLGTHTGESLGIEPTGRTLALREVDIWQVSDSILAGRWNDLRDSRLFRQLSSQHLPEDPAAPAPR